MLNTIQGLYEVNNTEYLVQNEQTEFNQNENWQQKGIEFEIDNQNTNSKIFSAPLVDAYVPNKMKIFSNTYGQNVNRVNDFSQRVNQVYFIVECILNKVTAGYDEIIGRPHITYNQGSIFISTEPVFNVRVPYFSRGENVTMSSERIYYVEILITRLLNARVVLDIVNTEEPYMDANIFARYLAEELSTKKFARVSRRVLANVSPLSTYTSLKISLSPSSLPAYLVGVSIQLDGRLGNEKTRPRDTKQSVMLGSLTPTANSTVQIGSHTFKIYKGVYTISISLCTRIV